MMPPAPPLPRDMSSSAIIPQPPSSSSTPSSATSTSAIAGSLKTRRALPTRIRDPWVSIVSVTGSPLTRVPFVEPRSRSVNPFKSLTISAWCAEAILSWRTIVLESRRPNVVRGARSGIRSPLRSPAVHSRKQTSGIARRPPPVPDAAADAAPSGSSKRSLVSPTSMTSPCFRRRRSTAEPLTRVPLVDFRSTRSNPPPGAGTSSQCLREALPSPSSTTAFPGTRPTERVSPVNSTVRSETPGLPELMMSRGIAAGLRGDPRPRRRARRRESRNLTFRAPSKQRLFPSRGARSASG